MSSVHVYPVQPASPSLAASLPFVRVGPCGWRFAGALLRAAAFSAVTSDLPIRHAPAPDRDHGSVQWRSVSDDRPGDQSLHTVRLVRLRPSRSVISARVASAGSMHVGCHAVSFDGHPGDRSRSRASGMPRTPCQRATPPWVFSQRGRRRPTAAPGAKVEPSDGMHRTR